MNWRLGGHLWATDIFCMGCRIANNFDLLLENEEILHKMPDA